MQLHQSNYYKILSYIRSTIRNYIHGDIAVRHQVLNAFIYSSDVTVKFIVGLHIVAISIEYYKVVSWIRTQDLYFVVYCNYEWWLMYYFLCIWRVVIVASLRRNIGKMSRGGWSDTVQFAIGLFRSMMELCCRRMNVFVLLIGSILFSGRLFYADWWQIASFI